MKTQATFLCALALATIYGCSLGPEDDALEALPEPITYTTLNADTSDFFVAPDFAWDIEVEGNFIFEENSPFDKNNSIALDKELYKASYSGHPIINSRLYNTIMDPRISFDSLQLHASSSWQAEGTINRQKTLKWEFIDFDKEKGFILIMKEFPQQIRLINKPDVLHVNRDNTIYFEKNTSNDSIMFSLLVIPKKNFQQNNTGHIYSQLEYPIKAEAGKIVIPREHLTHTISGNYITASDSVFLNMVSIKRVFKVINGRTIAITYKVNNINPIIFEQ